MPTVEDVRAEPLRYLGRTVTVTGVVDTIVQGDVFVLEGDGVVWPKRVLVVAKGPVQFASTPLRQEEELIVRGTVRRMTRGDVDRELDRVVSLDLMEHYADQPVVVADSIRLVNTQAMWSAPYQQGAFVSAIRLMSAVSPEVFAGHAVDLPDVPITTMTDHGMWVGFGPHSELFVVPIAESQLATLESGDHVAIRGMVRDVRASDPDAALQLTIDPARVRGETVYLEAIELTKLTPRPSS